MWSPPQISEAATEKRFFLEKVVRTEFVRTILAKSDDQFGHLISPFTLLPDDVIAQRIGQLHSLAVAEGTAPQFAG